MINESVTIPVHLDAPTFKNFAVFDTLKRQKRWKSPAIFAGILLVFACICYAMNSRADQAIFIGNVLLTVAVVLPAVYFGMFFHSLNTQAKTLKLNASRLVYTLILGGGEDGISVISAKGEQTTVKYRWDTLYRAYRTSGCIYLYVSERQAFLIPIDQGSITQDELWDFLLIRMGTEKLFNSRK